MSRAFTAMGNKFLQALFSSLLLAAPVCAADTLQEVMLALSRVQHSEASYQEEKHIAILDLPLVQSGRMSYAAPDQFSRCLDAPAAGCFLVQGDKVTLKRKNSEEIHDLNDLPMVRAFVASFGATLAGNLSSLQRHYEVSFSGGMDAWRMRLRPKDTRLSFYVSEILLWGDFDQIRIVETHEVSGDWSRMTLTHD